MIINYGVFEKELSKKFSLMPRLVTEDLIRQWFIDTQGLTYGETTIEKPYRTLNINPPYKTIINNRARADLYYQENGDEDVVIEFKYHKKVETSATCKTTNMGEVFRDLNRLACLGNKEKYFIYVFDDEMKQYYDKNSPSDILKIGNENIIKTIPQQLSGIEKNENGEFFNSAFSSFSKDFQDFCNFNYTVKVLYSGTLLANKFYMIILKITNKKPIVS